MLHFVIDHPITVFSAAIFAVALIWGRTSERLGAGAMIAEWVLEAVTTGGHSKVAGVTPAILGDFLLACSLLVLSIRYARFWLGFAMILQSVGLALHAMALGDEAPTYEIYAAALNLTTLLIVVSLLCGTIASMIRTRRGGGVSYLAPPPQLERDVVR